MISSQAAVIAPVRRPIFPAGTDGSQCTANARVAPSRTPEATTSVAGRGSVRTGEVHTAVSQVAVVSVCGSG